MKILPVPRTVSKKISVPVRIIRTKKSVPRKIRTALSVPRTVPEISVPLYPNHIPYRRNPYRVTYQENPYHEIRTNVLFRTSTDFRYGTGNHASDRTGSGPKISRINSDLAVRVLSGLWLFESVSKYTWAM